MSSYNTIPQMPPPEKLSSYDYEIIEFIDAYGTISEADLSDHFQGKIEALDLRAKSIAIYEYDDKQCNGYLWYTNHPSYTPEEPHKLMREYKIAPLGKKILQDRRAHGKAERIEFWKKLLLSKWIDISVGFIVAAIANANWDVIYNFVINLLHK